MGEYEECFSNWKISGEHGGFGENKDKNSDAEDPEPPKLFSDFVTTNSLLYLHEFDYQFPDVLYPLQ